MKAAALAAAFLLGGCALEAREPPEVEIEMTTGLPAQAPEALLVWTVVVDPNVPPWELERTLEATDAWVAASAGCPMAFEVRVAKTGGVDEPLPGPQVIELRMGTPPVAGAVGWAKYEPGGARIVLLPNDTDEARADFPRVVRHEIGHAMGLDHGGRLMASPPLPGSEIAPMDAGLYASKWCARRG